MSEEKTLHQRLDEMEAEFAAFLIEARKNASGNKAAGARARKAYRTLRNFTGNQWAYASMSDDRKK